MRKNDYSAQIGTARDAMLDSRMLIGTEASREIDFVPAARTEVDGVVELMLLRPPAYWMRSVSVADLRAFLQYSAECAYSVLLVARPKNAASPAGYAFTITNTPRFWRGFALGNPALARSIVFHRLRRLRELRRRGARRASAGGGAAGLPAFSWSPGRLGYARIIGVYVRKEYRDQPIAMYLYFSLFDVLKAKGCARVEEYAAPDYADWAGNFPEVCGWSLQPCACGGYKISRAI